MLCHLVQIECVVERKVAVDHGDCEIIWFDRNAQHAPKQPAQLGDDSPRIEQVGAPGDLNGTIRKHFHGFRRVPVEMHQRQLIHKVVLLKSPLERTHARAIDPPKTHRAVPGQSILNPLCVQSKRGVDVQFRRYRHRSDLEKRRLRELLWKFLAKGVNRQEKTERTVRERRERPRRRLGRRRRRRHGGVQLWG